ncbi:lantibiotic dehydratase C-terminal domain-containing protein [Streptomyces sp. NPDC007172]|uniref:lantibiotic dehydratase C-terminal domain-containing protein n=1 Tax=Streptomyces sp. NPDC007172 TaxID=3364776 RepID=UPI00369B1AEF
MLNDSSAGVPHSAPLDRWVSAHVFTGHPLDLVLRRLVPAAVAELRQRGLADRYFFLRHWQGGPHLRLRVRLTTPAAETDVRAALDAHAEALFRELPASPRMSAHQYESLARELAAREPESEPGVLAPPDSLVFHDYRPEHGKYGYGTTLRAVEDAFATCSELALDAALAEWSPARRTAHCFALLTGTLDAATPPAGPTPTPDVLVQYGSRRAALLTVARAARAASQADSGTDPVSRWLAACRGVQRQAGLPSSPVGHLTHLACNRLGIRLGQEATLRGLALLAVRELASDDRERRPSKGCGEEAAPGTAAKPGLRDPNAPSSSPDQHRSTKERLR